MNKTKILQCHYFQNFLEGKNVYNCHSLGLTCMPNNYSLNYAIFEVRVDIRVVFKIRRYMALIADSIFVDLAVQDIH